MVEKLTAIGAHSKLGAGSLEGIFKGVLWEWREGRTKTSERAMTVGALQCGETRENMITCYAPPLTQRPRSIVVPTLDHSDAQV